MLRTLAPRVAPARTYTVAPAPKVADPFYLSKEWQALLAEIIAERGRCCEDPEHDPKRPRRGIRLVGDHIHEIKDGGLRLDKRNVMLRCFPCHGRKTAAARAARARKG